MAPVTGDSGARIIEAVVDSGAEDSVTPPNLFAGPVASSPMSRAGRNYRAANGSPIPNLGQMIAHFRDAGGRACVSLHANRDDKGGREALADDKVFRPSYYGVTSPPRHNNAGPRHPRPG